MLSAMPMSRLLSALNLIRTLTTIPTESYPDIPPGTGQQHYERRNLIGQTRLDLEGNFLNRATLTVRFCNFNMGQILVSLQKWPPRPSFKNSKIKLCLRLLIS